MSTALSASSHLDQIFPSVLPGPVIGEQTLTPDAVPMLPPILQEAYSIASREGVKVKLVICRLPGTPVRADGSHEVRMLVPLDRPLSIFGTTI